jgi:hypothetical protein
MWDMVSAPEDSSIGDLFNRRAEIVCQEGRILEYVFFRHGPFYEGDQVWRYDPALTCGCIVCAALGEGAIHPILRYMGFESVCATCDQCCDRDQVCPEHQVRITMEGLEELLALGLNPNEHPYILFP